MVEMFGIRLHVGPREQRDEFHGWNNPCIVKPSVCDDDGTEGNDKSIGREV
jgi:hypothetical protein